MQVTPVMNTLRQGRVGQLCRIELAYLPQPEWLPHLEDHQINAYLKVA